MDARALRVSYRRRVGRLRRWLRGVRSASPWPFDVALALVVTTLNVLTVTLSTDATYDYRDADGVIVGFAVLSGVALIPRRRMPLPSHVVVLASTAVPSFYDYNVGSMPLAVSVATFSVACWARRPQALAGLLVVMATLVMLTVADTFTFEGANAIVTLVVYALAWVFGDVMRGRRVVLEQAQQRARDLELRRAEDATRAVAEERLRIAQELHDVVAHAMSVVAVQSGAAAHVIDRSPEQAKAALRTIEHTSREALQELRRMLGVLRSGDEGPGSLVPTPSLADLDDLAARFRAVGMDLELEHSGDTTDLPPSLQLSAYRVVQESLTNVLRHAGPAHARVSVRSEPFGVSVEVLDDGRGGAATFVDGAGHGIAGMRERVALFGGSLDAGPRRDGPGYHVRAVLPLRDQSVESAP